MGQPIPDHLQGKTLRPWLEKAGDVVHKEDVFVEWNGPNSGFGDVLGQVSIPEWMARLASREQALKAFSDPVRAVVTSDGWKFNYSPFGEHELYHLTTDPFETKNLATDPEYQRQMQRLAQRIMRWQEDTEDKVDLPLT
jgi:hypothetical protein